MNFSFNRKIAERILEKKSLQLLFGYLSVYEEDPCGVIFRDIYSLSQSEFFFKDLNFSCQNFLLSDIATEDFKAMGITFGLN